MTSEETAKLLRAISAAYPNYNPKDMKDTAEIWTLILGDLSFTAVFAAFRSYLDEGHDYAPNAGQLRALLRNVTSVDPTEAEAWNMVLAGAIKKSDSRRNFLNPAQSAFSLRASANRSNNSKKRFLLSVICCSVSITAPPVSLFFIIISIQPTDFN